MAVSVLVVEDELLVARDLSGLLTELGYRVTAVASTPEEALAAAHSSTPDLVLLDVRLGNQSDGVAVAEWFNANHSVPIVYLTAHADELTLARARATRPYAYMLKPYNGRELAIALEMALARWEIDQRVRDQVEAQARSTAELLDRRMVETQRLESIGLLASEIVHDFNNLLTGIYGAVETAREHVAPGSLPQLELEHAALGLQQATSLAAQLLSYAGRGPAEYQPVAVNTIVRNLARLVRTRLQGVAELELRLNPLMLPVLGNSTQLMQVVMNLLINASEAFNATYGRIIVRTDLLQIEPDTLPDLRSDQPLRAGQYVRISVQDNGVGMSPEVSARIFEPFFSTKRAGHGLGLAAVDGIIRRHAGALRVESQLGRGTTFEIYLPLAEQPLRVAAHLSETTAHSMLTAAAGAQPRTVLVVDDEPEVAGVIERQLQRVGVSVMTVPDGLSALHQLQVTVPPLAGVLLDLSLPGISGQNTLRAIQQLFPHVPVVVMTGYSVAELIGHPDWPQPLGFLQKPFTRAALEAAIAPMLAPDPTGNQPDTQRAS